MFRGAGAEPGKGVLSTWSGSGGSREGDHQASPEGCFGDLEELVVLLSLCSRSDVV